MLLIRRSLISYSWTLPVTREDLWMTCEDSNDLWVRKYRYKIACQWPLHDMVSYWWSRVFKYNTMTSNIWNDHVACPYWWQHDTLTTQHFTSACSAAYSQCLHIGPFIHIPDLDTAVMGTTEQLVRTFTECQTLWRWIKKKKIFNHWSFEISQECIRMYPQSSNVSHTLVRNKIGDHYDVVGASPVGTFPTTSSFLTLTPRFNGLGKGNCKTRQDTFNFWDLV